MSVSRLSRDDDAPGRIPESLIDAVLDGSVDDRTKQEVARALRHDPRRRQDVEETIEAIDALRMPVACPDLSDGVLRSLDRKHRFLPARVRRSIRQARLGLGVAAMLALVGVAVAQRAMPRLASIRTPTTPISDVAQAMQADAEHAANDVRGGVRMMQASLPGVQQAFGVRQAEGMQLGVPGQIPGRSFRLDIDTEEMACKPADVAYRIIAIDGGRYLMLDTVRACASSNSGDQADSPLLSLVMVSSADASPKSDDVATEQRSNQEIDELP